MKKVLFTLAVVLGMATAAQAQLVVGGSIGFNGGSDKTMRNGNWGAQANHVDDVTLKNYGKISTFGFSIAPSVGYIINDNMQVGAKLAFNYGQSDFYAVFENVDGKSAAKVAKDNRRTDFSWSIDPYFRYRLFDVKGFGFWLQAECELGTTLESKTKYYAYGDQPNTTAGRTADAAKDLNKDPKGHKYSKFNGAGYIKPVLTYDINEHWIIESELDLLSIGVWGYAEKTTEEYVPGTGYTVKTVDRDGKEAPITQTTNSCNFNLGLFQGKALSLGVVYKF